MEQSEPVSPEEINSHKKERSAAFYQVLREFYVGRSEQSEQVITSFEADPDANRQELVALLRSHLPEDHGALAQQVQTAMGPEGAQFVNLVTGGHVDQLVNIACLGVLVLKIEQTRIFYFFRDVRQVIAFLAMLVLVFGSLAYGMWYSRQPKVMTGDFNIAVAEFHETSTLGAATGVAEVISQQLATFLDQEYQLISFEEVQVAHDKIGVIREAEQAEALAEKIRADLIIYGVVTVVGDEAQISPKFYVAEPFRPDAGEIGGQHQLALPVTFSTDDLLRQDSEVNLLLQQRTAILTEFTKGLAYRATGDQVLALEAMDTAIDYAVAYGDFSGKEVIYMIASDVARLQKSYNLAHQYVDEALALNQNYGRAYIARGNIYYEQGDLFQAQAAYREALTLPDQPFGAYVAEKARLGLGNISVFHLQEMRGNELALESERIASANDAIDQYQAVIDSYRRLQQPEAQLREMAAWAYYGAGIAYQTTNRLYLAETAFTQALTLTESDDLTARGERRLLEMRES